MQRDEITNLVASMLKAAVRNPLSAQPFPVAWETAWPT
jgi:hypothetical protein